MATTTCIDRGWKRIFAEPAEEPITLTKAKEHLRITHTDEDAKILNLIKAARISAEMFTSRKFVTQTWEQILDEFPDVIELEYAPVQSITHVKYYDTNNAFQTLASTEYALTKREPAWVHEEVDKTWPSTEDKRDAVEIRYIVGYGTSNDVPEPIKQAMYLAVGWLYENREVTKADMGAWESLLAPYQLRFF